MGKKRKKSVAPPAPQQTEIQVAEAAPEAPVSQPAMSEEKAAAQLSPPSAFLAAVPRANSSAIDASTKTENV